MAIKHIRELPCELPHALLYLDDIEDIQRLLVDAYTAAEDVFKKKIHEKYPSPDSERKPEVRAVYEVDGREMDSITDLTEYGLSAKNFRLVVVSDGVPRGHFIVGGLLREPVLILTIPLLADAQWSTYSKVKAILDHRQLRSKNAILNLPNWLKVPLFGLIVWLFPQLALLAHYPVRLFLYLAWLPFFAATMYVIFRPSRVYFVRSHERSKLSESARQSYIKAVLLLATGALVTKVFDWLFAHFKH